MGDKARGRIQIEPGAWSRAVADSMSRLIDLYPGQRSAFAVEAGFSTRLSQLLNGRRAWYLEDVDRACTALGLELIEFLDSLNLTEWPEVGEGIPHPALASVTRFPTSDPAFSLQAVADEQAEEIGSDPDSGYDGA